VLTGGKIIEPKLHQKLTFCSTIKLPNTDSAFMASLCLLTSDRKGSGSGKKAASPSHTWKSHLLQQQLVGYFAN